MLDNYRAILPPPPVPLPLALATGRTRSSVKEGVRAGRMDTLAIWRR